MKAIPKLLIVSIVFYLVSLLCPFTIDDFEFYGFNALLLGWVVFPSLDFFCWLANFTLLASWILINKSYQKYWVWTTVILMATYGIDYIFRLNFFVSRSYDEKILAYWFWLLSGVVLLFRNAKTSTQSSKSID